MTSWSLACALVLISCGQTNQAPRKGENLAPAAGGPSASPAQGSRSINDLLNQAPTTDVERENQAFDKGTAGTEAGNPIGSTQPAAPIAPAAPQPAAPQPAAPTPAPSTRPVVDIDGNTTSMDEAQEQAQAQAHAALAAAFPLDPPASLKQTCDLTMGEPTIDLTTGNDQHAGTPEDDRIRANDGEDTIGGGNGNDIINGNGGADFLNGNSGNDQVRGGQGDDRVFGGQGDDCVTGDLGNDIVQGSLGSDMVIGGDGDDNLQPAGDGGTPASCADPTFLTCSLDWLDGGAGNDMFVVRAGDGRVVIMPDNSGTNVLQCPGAGPMTSFAVGNDRYLKGNAVLIKIVGGNVPGQTNIDQTACK